MALHRLTSVVMGVPNVAQTAAYYADFGLSPDGDGWFTTRDGGRQLQIVPAQSRRLVELHVGADDHDDLSRVADRLAHAGVPVERGPESLTAVEPATGIRATLEIAPRLMQDAVAATLYNGPGRLERQGACTGTDAHRPGDATQAGPCRRRHHRSCRHSEILRRLPGLQGQRLHQDQLWKPEVLEDAKGLFNWGPPPPASFLAPEDLAALMTGSHSAR